MTSLDPHVPYETLVAQAAEVRKKRSVELKDSLLEACKSPKLTSQLDGSEVKWEEQSVRDAFCAMVPEDRVMVYEKWKKALAVVAWKRAIYLLIVLLVVAPAGVKLHFAAMDWLKGTDWAVIWVAVYPLVLLIGIVTALIVIASRAEEQLSILRPCLARLRVCVDFPVD